MPRKSAAKKVEEPLSDDVSAQSDVEMQDQQDQQDQQDDKMSGFKKFGVSATAACAFPHSPRHEVWHKARL